METVRPKRLIMGGLILLSGIILILISTANAAPAGQIEGGNIYRVRNVTKNTAFTNPATADPCETVQFRVRIHNPGPDALTGVNVRATLSSGSVTSHSSTVTVSAANANPPSTSDTAGVNVSSAAGIAYVGGSTELLDANGSRMSGLPDGILSGGVSVPDGVGVSVDQQRYVQFKAKLDCPPPKPSTGVCKALTAQVTNRDERRVSATVTGEVSNAEIIGYRIEWGDGATSNTQTATHQYAADGRYTITGYVQVRFADGTTEWKTANACKATVEFKKQPPKPSEGYCKDIDVDILSSENREVRATVAGQVENAEVIGYRIEWGDGQTSNTQTATHQYASDGSYTIVGSVNVRFADGKTEWKTADACKHTVKFKKGEKPSIGVCKALDVKITDKMKREVEAKVTGHTENAQIVGYKIEWGDGASSNTQQATHRYSKDGTYTITGSVQVKYTDGKTEWKTADACKTTLKFEKKPQPPKPEQPDNPQPPTVIVTVVSGGGHVAGATTVAPTATLPKTGPAEIAVSVLGASVLGATFHRLFLSRRVARGQ